MNLHSLIFDLPPGGEFRHSANNPTIFAGDVIYFVLRGELTLANPQTGEVAVAQAGTGLLFHRDTWHNGFNAGPDTLQVLEFFSPPPARGTASVYAHSQTLLQDSTFSDSRWRKRWPAARNQAEAARTFHPADPGSGLLSFRDSRASHRLSTIVDTDFLRVDVGTVSAGHIEDVAPCEHETLIYVTEGELWVDVWHENVGFTSTAPLTEGQSVFLPIGSFSRILNRSNVRGTYVKGSGSVPEDWRP